jgi:hypothetical protein
MRWFLLTASQMFRPSSRNNWSPHRQGTALILEQNQAFDSVDVGLLGADILVFEADFMTELIEKLRLVIHLWAGI